jgi:ribosome modulation factor
LYEHPHVKFHFNLQHPTLEECYTYGYECACADVSVEDNPYLETSKEGEQWLEGWWTGFYGESPLFDWEKDVAPYEGFELLADNDVHFHEARDSYLTKVKYNINRGIDYISNSKWLNCWYFNNKIIISFYYIYGRNLTSRRKLTRMD